jgi:alanyl-tRNA synthetase
VDGPTIRETFLAFFEARGHRRVPSSSLIPPPESGLLLTNAGMNQFIPYFLGKADPPFRRATTVQKCFRANDIDNVGHTDRHLTFFEMLGNFSFGDYFKAESCAWGLELVTQGFGIDPQRLWVTVFETDEETAGIWQDLGIPAARIVRRGKADNYWSTHTAGPGGPCSEIYVDRGPRYGPEGGPAVDEDRFLEIWNHVFMQDLVDEHDEVVGELPAKNIDTGASVERIALVLQDAPTVFETDLFRPLIEEVERLANTRYGDDERRDVSIRIVAEHARATSFLVADGVQPSNEGRGYILRRMLRRVVSHARRLGIEGEVMAPLVAVVVDRFGDAYPELVQNRAFVEQVTSSEEERFAATLRQGMERFAEAAARARGRLAGEDVFLLHDTFGFPPELVAELAGDQGLEVDLDRYEALMAEQRERARRAARRVEVGADARSLPPSTFVGYAEPQAESRIELLLDDERREVAVVEEGAQVAVVLGRTPFYAEAGGQVGDRGEIRTSTGAVRVDDAQWAGPNTIVHLGTVVAGEVRAGQEALATIDRERREATARAHTSTHVVHWTLRHVLGEHARQAGSLVAPGRLRFDFPHPSPLDPETLERAELEANRRLAADDPVKAFETTMDEARALGAIALFGEKYGDLVRVVEIGDYSRELCGGTHVAHTGRVAVVRFLSEGSIGAGMRRLEAAVGPDALREINAERELLRGLVEALGAPDAQAALEHARRVVEENKRLRSELGRLRRQDRDAVIASLVESAQPVDGVALVVSEVPGEDPAGLRELAQRVRDRLAARPAVVVVGNAEGGKPILVAATTPAAVERGITAPRLLEPASKVIGGGAGGKDGLANAGGTRADRLGEALGQIPERLRELLGTS